MSEQRARHPGAGVGCATQFRTLWRMTPICSSTADKYGFARYAGSTRAPVGGSSAVLAQGFGIDGGAQDWGVSEIATWAANWHKLVAGFRALRSTGQMLK